MWFPLVIGSVCGWVALFILLAAVHALLLFKDTQRWPATQHTHLLWIVSAFCFANRNWFTLHNWFALQGHLLSFWLPFRKSCTIVCTSGRECCKGAEQCSKLYVIVFLLKNNLRFPALHRIVSKIFYPCLVISTLVWQLLRDYCTGW